MKLKLLAFCILAMLVLTGCKGSGGGGRGSALGGGGFVGSVFGGGSSVSGGSSFSGTGSSGSGSPAPEPATVALLGGGLAAYAFLKRKKRK